MPYDATNGDYFDKQINFEDLKSIYQPQPDLERFERFNSAFANPTHNLSPVTTAEGFALEQLQNSIDQAIFWVGVAESWGTEYGTNRDCFSDLKAALERLEAARITAGIKD